MITLLRKLLNLPLLAFRKHQWRIHPKRWMNLDHTPVNRPVFLLGVQGGCLTYTVRLSLLNALLGKCSPNFILLTRNPYASCYRDATRIKSLQSLDIPLPDRLQLAAQHWSNSFNCALFDAAQVSNFLVQSFEELLRQPTETLKRICSFLDLSFQERMLPTLDDRFPLGSTGSSKGDHKWYPLRSNVNHKYLNGLEPWMVEVLKPYVGDLAEKWHYTPEGP